MSAAFDCPECGQSHKEIRETAPLLRARADLAQRPFWCIGHPEPLRNVP